MAELPLSKFAPFTKEECHFQIEVSNKLDEIGVKCSECIYFGDKANPPDEEYYPYHPNDNRQRYHCNILSNKWGDDLVCENSLCRFFTNKEEIKEVEDKISEGESDEELSIQIQKLDFTNSSITESIKKLREKLINEQL